MIRIKQNREKWILGIESEEWQFESREEMEKSLKTILDLKSKNGQLRGDER